MSDRPTKAKMNELLEHIERLEGTLVYIRDVHNGHRREDRLKRTELINEMIRSKK